MEKFAGYKEMGEILRECLIISDSLSKNTIVDTDGFEPSEKQIEHIKKLIMRSRKIKHMPWYENLIKQK